MSAAELDPSRVVITGAGGLVGHSLQQELPSATCFEHEGLGIDDVARLEQLDWGDYDVIINAAAFTRVNDVETPEGYDEGWITNGFGVSALAAIAIRHGIKVVHFSSDYVFDGSQHFHSENERPNPLNEFGRTKAYGDLVVGHKIPEHLLIRTGWIFGHGGRNFPLTMWKLAMQDVQTPMVNDEIGRPTYAPDLARAVRRLLETGANGTFNITNDGPETSWTGIAQRVYVAAGLPASHITGMPAAQRHAGNPSVAIRPQLSTYALDKALGHGLELPDWRERLEQYVSELATISGSDQ